VEQGLLGFPALWLAKIQEDFGRLGHSGYLWIKKIRLYFLRISW
jgi:hypothetical protein